MTEETGNRHMRYAAGVCCALCILSGGVALLAAAGCADPSGHVTGTVVYRGQPLPGGRVTFLCDGKGRPVATSRISEAGRYEMPKLPVGKAQVSVQTFKQQPKPPPETHPATGAPIENWEDYGQYVPIPKRYAAPHTSGLEYMIKLGDQSFNIVLQE